MRTHVPSYCPPSRQADLGDAVDSDLVRAAAKVWGIVSGDPMRSLDPEARQKALRAAQGAYRAAMGDTDWKPPRAYKWCHSMGGWCRETQKGRE